MANLETRILKGLSANVIMQGTSMLIQFCLIPIFLKFWGVELYGDWLLLYSVPAYLSFMDLGFGLTSSTLIAKPLSNKNYKESLKIFQSTLFITCIVGCVLILICFIMIIIFDLKSILRIDSFSSVEVNIAFLVLVIYVVIGLQHGIFTGIYNYNNKYHYSANITSIARLVEFSGMMIAVIYARSIIFVSLMMLLIKIFHFSFIIYDSKKLSPWLKISFKHKDVEYIKSQLFPSLSLMLYPISFAMLNQVISIIIGIKLGSSSLVLFNTVRTFVNSIKTFASQINNLLLSEIIKFFASSQILSAQRLYKKTTLSTTFLILVTGTVLIIFGSLFISVWTDGKLDTISSMYIVAFISESITYNLWHANYNTYLAQNRHTLLTVYFFFSSIIIVILTYNFIVEFGVAFFLYLSTIVNLALFFSTKSKLFIISEDKRNKVTRLYFSNTK